ncbi:MAG: hypothetical protein K9I85_02500 [Saprospiraceae bacterium]|nr:hypothetical protein [Saprospiraceae bacterium]
MNWMDLNKTGDFWKAWQDSAKAFSGQSQPATDPVKEWWSQQEKFWKEAMEKTTGILGNQPDLAKQWQDMQGNFMKQWTDMAKSSMSNPSTMGAGSSDMWKQFAQQTETWYADAFKNKLPEQLRPHFQTYMDMYKMFTSQWENIQGMIKNGLVEPKMIWQMINPVQYGDAIGKVMGFKPMKDLDEVTRQANRFFEQLRNAAMKMFPAAEEQVLEMNEAFNNWSNQQSDQFFPFLNGVQEVMKQNLEPYFHLSGDDNQTEVLRSLKEMQFSYLAYLHHSAKLQKMVLDAGATVLPAMMQEARDTFGKEEEMPTFDTFFKTYMDRLENAILETMQTDAYTTTQNEVLASGAKSKMIYDEMLENIFKDWPFMTKREADDLAKEAAQLRRRVRDLETRMANVPTSMNGTATKVSSKVEPKVAAIIASPEAVISRIGTAPKGVADDLKEIKGIGAKLEELLKEMGIATYKQVAKMDDAVYTMIDELIPAFKGRAKREKWAVQAKKLLKAKTLV